MNFFFKKKYLYRKSDKKLIERKTGLNEIQNNHDFLPSGIIGKIDKDGLFSIKLSTLPLMSYGWVQLSYLKGKIISENPFQIEVVSSPNVILVLFIYFSPLIALNIIFGDNSLMGGNGITKSDSFFSLLMMTLALFVIIKGSSYYLIKKFERRIRPYNLLRIQLEK